MVEPGSSRTEEGPAAGSGPAWAQTRVARALGIRYPILQGAFGGFRSQPLAAAVSNFGGLGAFGAHGLSPAQIGEVVAELKSLTGKPFAINLWVSMEDAGARAAGEADFLRARAAIAPHLETLGGQLPAYAPYRPQSFEAQARALIDAKPPVFSFIYGVPPREILDECRRQGIRTVGAATTADEALALRDSGLDALIASGFEGGGHRGSFLRPAEESLTGTFSLVPQLARVTGLPIVAAGGIADAQGALAAFALGAEGIVLGTALLACLGSGASEKHRQLISSGQPARTGLTAGFTGRLARGLENALMRELNQPGTPILPYPLQRALVKSVTALAEPAGRDDLAQMWAGQGAGLSRFRDALALLEALVRELEPLAGPVLEWAAKRRAENSSVGQPQTK